MTTQDKKLRIRVDSGSSDTDYDLIKYKNNDIKWSDSYIRKFLANFLAENKLDEKKKINLENFLTNTQFRRQRENPNLVGKVWRVNDDFSNMFSSKRRPLWGKRALTRKGPRNGAGPPCGPRKTSRTRKTKKSSIRKLKSV
jgi:hypothetical protein